MRSTISAGSTPAAEAYDRIVAHEPGMAEVWHTRSHALLQLQRPDEALASIERALALQPHEPRYELQRANCLARARPQRRRDRGL